MFDYKDKDLRIWTKVKFENKKKFVRSNGEHLTWLVDTDYQNFRIVPKDENEPYKNLKIMIDGKAAYIGRIHIVKLTTEPDTFIWNLVDVKESDSKITCKIHHIYGGNRYWSCGTCQYTDPSGVGHEDPCIVADWFQETFTIEERIFD